jgi:putative phosphoesterase
MQKIAIISDIHGNIVALEKVVEDIKTRHVDCVFNLGDHISGPLWPKETIQYLMKQEWTQISGNHERQLISQDPENHGPSDRYAFQFLNASELTWLRSLPGTQINQNRFLLVHGTPSSDTAYFLETVVQGYTRLATPDEIMERLGEVKWPVILCGHTHISRVVETTDHILIVNPGSVGLPAFEDHFPEYHVVESGSPHARYAILENRDESWTSELIAVPYDYQTAARQAGKNGRPDWELALRSGFMR